MTGPTDETPTNETPTDETPTDETPTDETPTDETPTNEAPTGETPARRPSPGAQAASRARRIGGRPLPGPRPGAGTDESPAAAVPAKPAGATAAPLRRPARQRPAATPRRQPNDAAYHRLLGRIAGVLIVVSLVAVVALLGVGAWLSHGVWWAKTPTDAKRNAARQQVLAAAKTCTSRILSYDYRTLAASEKAGQDCSTGTLHSDYTKLMDTTVKPIAPQNKVVQLFQVEKAGIASVSPDGKQWVVVVYGQEQVTSSTVTAGPRLDISNAVVTLNKVGGRWLISSMTTTS